MNDRDGWRIDSRVKPICFAHMITSKTRSRYVHTYVRDWTTHNQIVYRGGHTAATTAVIPSSTDFRTTTRLGGSRDPVTWSRLLLVTWSRSPLSINQVA